MQCILLIIELFMLLTSDAHHDARAHYTKYMYYILRVENKNINRKRFLRPKRSKI